MLGGGELKVGHFCSLGESNFAQIKMTFSLKVNIIRHIMFQVSNKSIKLSNEFLHFFFSRIFANS